jgi:predicted RNA-binding Zn-ribbon protein involved in translation (DUF1610 family)
LTTTKQGPKIGLIDIETAPIKGNVWGLFDQNVGINQIDTEWSILSFTYKPLGGKKSSIVYRDTSGDPRNDKDIVQELWDIMHDHDFLIAQNGKRFDMKKMRARMIMHGMLPPSPVQVIDTLLMARQVASFTSNKLEWLSTYLSNIKKSSHKEFPGFELWTGCLEDNPRAWRAMEKYNVTDVTSMEQVYLKLRPWVTGHPNVAAYTDSEKIACPRCGSHALREDGMKRTNVSAYKRYQCNSCGGWSHDRYTINSKAKRRSLLSN